MSPAPKKPRLSRNGKLKRRSKYVRIVEPVEVNAMEFQDYDGCEYYLSIKNFETMSW